MNTYTIHQNNIKDWIPEFFNSIKSIQDLFDIDFANDVNSFDLNVNKIYPKQLKDRSTNIIYSNCYLEFELPEYHDVKFSKKNDVALIINNKLYPKNKIKTKIFYKSTMQ
jgi:hypothetical protein